MDVLTERTNRLVLDDDDDNYDEDDDDEEEEAEDDARVSLKKNKKNKKRVSLLSRSSTTAAVGTAATNHHDKKKTLLSRRRRRSSARFLQLHDPCHNDDDNNDNKTGEMDDSSSGLPFPSTQDLGQVYQNAIRMTAENKITASNSWNLNLIDHMDRFLGKPTTGSTGTGAGTTTSTMTLTTATMLEDTLGPITGVNFTKASCTLDASVKIYSYRVDDVHLTSYKVLANLNRTTTDQDHQDGGKKKDKGNNGGPTTTTEGDEEPAREQRRAGAKHNNNSTLETNLGTSSINNKSQTLPNASTQLPLIFIILTLPQRTSTFTSLMRHSILIRSFTK